MQVWLPRAKHTSAVEAINEALAGGKYGSVLLLFLGTIVASILGPENSQRLGRGRLLFFSTTLLLTVLAIGDLKFNSLLGMTEAPWTSYRNAIALAIRSNERPPVGVPDKPEMQQARAKLGDILHRLDRDSFGVAYTGVIALSVVAANWFFLFMSLLLTRQILGDVVSAVSWSARLGSILVSSAGSVIFALACTVAVGLLCNPAIWIVLILAAALKSMLVFIVGAILALAFEWWISGPWFKVLLVVALLPSLCMIVLAGGDWIDNARRLVIARFGQVAVAPMLARRGDVAIPVIATALILLLSAVLIWWFP
jgi:hypothetical protein